MTATAELHRYAELANEKANLEAKLLTVKAELEQLQPQALEWFQREGVNKVSLDGRTLYLRKESWAVKDNDGVTAEQQIEALRGAGLDDFCAPKVNSATLSAWCREREAAGEPLPPSFAGVIRLSTSYKIGSTKK